MRRPRLPLVLFIIVVITAIIGFSGSATAAVSVAKTVFYIFAALFLASLIFRALKKYNS